MEDADAVVAEAADDGTAGTGAEACGADARLGVEGFAESGLEFLLQVFALEESCWLDLLEQSLIGAVRGHDDFIERGDGVLGAGGEGRSEEEEGGSEKWFHSV